MTYLELRELIATTAHRTDLTDRVPGFVKLTESILNRQLRAIEMERMVWLDEGDRDDGPVYNLPFDWLEIRSVHHNGRALNKVNYDRLAQYVPSMQTFYYTTYGEKIEFAGTPTEDSTFKILYFGRIAPLVDDLDTNVILDRYPDIYLYGTLAHIYMSTQDLELASAHLEAFNSTITGLNDLASRGRGGAGVSPGYNLGNYSMGGY